MYSNITRVSFTSCSDTPEFVIHNNYGDLRFCYDKKSSDPNRDLLIKLKYLKDFFENWRPDHNIQFFSLLLPDLSIYHNTKK